MIELKFLTSDDEKKDKALKLLINRKVNLLSELTERDPLESTLIALDIAIEYFKDHKTLKMQKKIIEAEKWRTEKEKFFKAHRV